ncbi:hypothetical protein [Facklamia sp. HMSC062C11]|uniref:hypothetical protein n=1 Tax=Facklamia sp. HMSC062C11 TaxID=1739262 RepID=UPI000A94E581|nr:hypothetical protein [Facklamia sp. HMSC062C11]
MRPFMVSIFLNIGGLSHIRLDESIGRGTKLETCFFRHFQDSDMVKGASVFNLTMRD